MPDDTGDSLPSEEAAKAPDSRTSVHASQEALAVKDAKIEELTDTVKRVQAEFENYRKRTDREWAERSKLAGEGVILDLLPVLDTLDNAVAEADVESGVDGDGLKGIRKQLLQTLQRAGLREIPTDGPFDPFLHEAMMKEETESGEAGRILEVFQKGYMLGPKVIRAARVKVSVGPSRTHTSDANGGSIDNDDEHIAGTKEIE